VGVQVSGGLHSKPINAFEEPDQTVLYKPEPGLHGRALMWHAHRLRKKSYAKAIYP
jgi:hypothetical protein